VCDTGTDENLVWDLWTLTQAGTPPRSWKKDVNGGTCKPTSASLSKAEAARVTVPLPDTYDKCQALLHATRSFTPPKGSAPRTLVSNPVLITVGGS
jgi:hypothetical protein